MNSITPGRKADWLETLRRAAAIVEALPVERPCRLCDSFDNGSCRRWSAEIPAAAQGQGCDAFEDAVPF
ncbi:hypothetical protein [Tahibacter harae]|uniref:PH (Pleckstrin Homology) domain-containing protein n=1 Tax=Tahibacter harae TaxID=2963937 RepID=A0ABT1QS42_9GAMM|nr:hypothetical protein [Tahibacter harae]MCQ4165100.1 hypothetical protein [Tahibacter harae]